MNFTIPLFNLIQFGETLSNCPSTLKMLQSRKKSNTTQRYPFKSPLKNPINGMQFSCPKLHSEGVVSVSSLYQAYVVEPGFRAFCVMPVE